MKNFKILLSVMLILLLFTGCTERNDLSDLSIVEGMGIDYNDDEVTVTVQTLNLAKEGSGAEALSGNVTMNTSGKGSNISDAIENVTESLSKKLFFGQNRIIVFGMGMAENYLEKNVDYLLRSSDSRSDVKICISEKDAAEIIDSHENDALVPAESITSLLNIGEKNGFAADVTTNELLNLYLDKTSDIFLPVVRADEKCVSVAGIAIFNDEKLVTVLDENSTFGFLILSNKIKTGFLNVLSDELGEIGVDIIKSKTKTYASVENGKVVLDAVEKGLINTITSNHLKEVEKLVENKISDICSNAFYQCVNGKSDSLRIGENLAMYSPKDYDALSDDWGSVLSEAQLDIKVNCKFKKINENSKGD